MNQFDSASLGAYFTFYYYFMSQYPTDTGEFLKKDGSLYDWIILVDAKSIFKFYFYL